MTNRKLLKIINLVTFLLLTNFAYSQDKEVSASDFNFTFKNKLLNINDNYFKQNNFMLGFQWSGTGRMHDALHMNARADNKAVGAGDWVPSVYGGAPNYIHSKDKIKLIAQPGQNATGYHMPYIRNAASMQYEPGMLILPNNPTAAYKGFLDDNMNPVFGFEYIRPGCINLNPPYSNGRRRLELKRSSLPVPTGGKLLVLKDPWPRDQLLTFDFGSEGGQMAGYDGKNWNISINLRAISSSTIGGSSTDPILVIKLPYKQKNGGTNCIKFKKYTDTSYSFVSLGSMRGLNVLDFVTYNNSNIYTDYTDEFVITRGMLPTNVPGSYTSSDVTISMPYVLTEEPISNQNPCYKDEGYQGGRIAPESTQIVEQGIEVYYCGNVDVAIDWIRIENNVAKNLYRGHYDSGYVPDSSCVSIQTAIQGFLNKIETDDTLKKYNEFFRFYGQDVENTSCQWWGMLRYWNLATNGITVVRDEPYLPELYYHYTKAPNRYLGITYSNQEHNMAAPFIRYGSGGNSNTSVNFFGYKYGNVGAAYNGFPEVLFDTLNSGYETFLLNSSIATMANSNTSLTAYRNVLDVTNSVQSEFEKEMMDYFYNITDATRNYFMFSDKPWWVNLWPATRIERKDSLGKKWAFFSELRPKTAEEVRLLISLPVLLGAKGLFIDREENEQIYNQDYNTPNRRSYKKNGYTGIGNGLNITPDLKNFIPDDLTADIVGEDYYNDWNWSNNPTTTQIPNGWGLRNIINGEYKYYNFNKTDLSTALGLPNLNSFYVGMASARGEIRRWFQWIQYNETDLMNLRLVAWKAKSFRSWYCQHPDTTTPNVINKYIDANNIKTYPVHRVIANNGNRTLAISEQSKLSSGIDSGFYDITLLKTMNNTTMTNTFYLGVQNRRTDPTFKSYNTTSFFMDFMSTEVWYRLIKNDSWWRSGWWKRLGCREIEIPIKPSLYGWNVEEVGANKNYLENQGGYNLYRDIELYSQFSASISKNGGNLIVRLMPGEGKILCFTKKINKESVEEETNILDNIKIYPNPANEAINISLNLMEESYLEIILCDIFGNEIINAYNRGVGSGNFDKIIDVRNLATGVYNLKIITNNIINVEKISIVR